MIFWSRRRCPDWPSALPDGNFVIWSAGCSTGEEPYTMAIVLSEYAAAHPGFRFRILASDISNIVLAKAELGVYTERDRRAGGALAAAQIFHAQPQAGLRAGARGAGVAALVEFRRLNFMDADYGMSEKVDAIFCRNVIIYFDRPTQERILQKLSSYLLPGGYMFVGHAETLHDMNLPLVPVAPALYRRVDGGG